MSKMSEIAKKHGAAFATEVIEEVLIPALKAHAESTKTPYDDMAIGVLEPIIREALEADFIKKLLPAKVG